MVTQLSSYSPQIFTTTPSFSRSTQTYIRFPGGSISFNVMGNRGTVTDVTFFRNVVENFNRESGTLDDLQNI